MTDNAILAELLVETGHHHHQAYISSDGVDPEWALWYAGFLQTKLWNTHGEIPTRSKLIYLLISAEEAFDSAEQNEEWPVFYARHILNHLT